MVGFIASNFALLSPVFSLVRSGYSKARKIILPKNTTKESLVQKNPGSLDTRNLSVTPLKDFETMGITDHETHLQTWRLRVTGHVREPLQLTYSQVLAQPSVERRILLICPGFFANHGQWKGISMKALLEKAKVKSNATHVTFSGPKGDYEKVERFPIEDIYSNKVFLAYGVNGETLPQKHGYPLRVVAEGYYGDEWVKYVHEMKVDKILPSNP